MPPKAAAAGQRYKAAKYYYNAAYRPRIKELRSWNPGQVMSTLNWMWAYIATNAEKAECERLFAENSRNDPVSNDDLIPAMVKVKSDPPPDPEEDGERGEEEDTSRPEQQRPEPRHSPQNNKKPPADSPSRSSSRPASGATATAKNVNTTAFPFWPAAPAAGSTLPAVEPPVSDMLTDSTMKRDLLAAGFLYSPEEANKKRWRGARMLGAGATGVSMLWVRTDDVTQNIERTMAVRDVGTIDRKKWTSPFAWRDRLPLEVAVQVRLDEQKGYEHSIHRYFGHRLDMSKRRYRVYNEVCEFGDLLEVLAVYSRSWRRRRDVYKWIEAHPKIRRALQVRRGNVASAMVSEEKADKFVQATHVEAWKEYVREREKRREGARQAKEDPSAAIKRLVPKEAKEGPRQIADREALEARTDIEFDTMSVVSDDGEDGLELEDELPNVIPEGFLWHVFRQLVDAVSVLHEGNGQEGGMPWKEIVHKDIHNMNVFVKPVDCGEGTVEAKSDNIEARRFREQEWPTMILADFDWAFFDLQSGEDDYVDNPCHYMLSERATRRGARYPPELFYDYAGHAQEPMEKFTSKTDIFAIGQLMWNLVMNLPSKQGRRQQPFFDNTGTRRELLVNGKPYDDDELSAEKGRFMSGKTPFEASSMYSKDLKDIIRMCLKYRQQDRPSIRKLKDLVEKYAAKERDTKADGELVLTVPRYMQDLRVGKTYKPT